jgi:hypothetical protein
MYIYTTIRLANKEFGESSGTTHSIQNDFWCPNEALTTNMVIFLFQTHQTQDSYRCPPIVQLAASLAEHDNPGQAPLSDSTGMAPFQLAVLLPNHHTPTNVQFQRPRCLPNSHMWRSPLVVFEPQRRCIRSSHT